MKSFHCSIDTTHMQVMLIALCHAHAGHIEHIQEWSHYWIMYCKMSVNYNSKIYNYSIIYNSISKSLAYIIQVFIYFFAHHSDLNNITK